MESTTRRPRLVRVRGLSTPVSPAWRRQRIARISVTALAGLALLACTAGTAAAQSTTTQPNGIVVAGPGGANGGPALDGHQLVVRVAPGDAALPLHGSTVAGDIYIAVEPANGIDRVTFHLDDPQRTRKAFRVENNAPFDFNGGTATVARDWDSASKPDGNHTITAVVLHVGGTSETIHATFRISNAAPPPPVDDGGGGGGDPDPGVVDPPVASSGESLRLRTIPGGTSAPLHGATIAGDAYIALEPTAGVDEVLFFLDDPDRSGTPVRLEVNPPFDFAGGVAAGALPWDTTEVGDGPHSITAQVLFLDDSTEVVTSVFTVLNDVPRVLSDLATMDFPFAAGATGSSTATAQITLSGGASAPFTLAAPQVGWLTLGVSSVMLPTTLSVTVNASGLAAGEHLANVTVSSLGHAPASIAVRVTIAGGGSGGGGGGLAFDDDLIRHDFTLAAPGTATSTVGLAAGSGASGSFTLSFASAPWLTISPLTGTIPATISVSVNSAGLAAGIHERLVTASVPGHAPATVMVRVVVASGDASLATSVSRHGVTWNFDGEYEVGQFANGDWYVVGPVLITSTSPSWTGTYDGAMINPVYHDDHGYDARFKHDPSLRVDTNDLLLMPGESLVQIDSWRDGESGAPSSNNTLDIPRPAIKTAAVLTCLAFAPPPGTFRPPYAGSDKPLHHVSSLRTWLLPELDAPAGTPSLSSVEDLFEGVWLDHGEKWTNRYMHPSEHMEDYGRDLASEFNTGSCMLMLDFTPAQKQTLMIRLVQIGIDMHAVGETGGRWGADTGGHGSGRKWPVILAGILLNDAGMMNIGLAYGHDLAQEDCQTFYLTPSQQSNYPGKSIGDPVWGERNCSQPSTNPGASSYRTCCTANAWVGAIISVHILTGETDIDVKALWNHDALFDYQDLYMEEQSPGTWQRSWSDFQEAMWDTYRADYGPVYVD